MVMFTGELTELNIKIDEAEKHREVVILTRVLANDLVLEQAYGEVGNKKHYFAALRSRSCSYETLIRLGKK